MSVLTAFLETATADLAEELAVRWAPRPALLWGSIEIPIVEDANVPTDELRLIGEGRTIAIVRLSDAER